jgi:DnaJ-class molecular chaperone
MSVRQKDLYKILGVIDSVESGVIKASYKALMMIYHPDRYENKEESLRRSMEINEAYNILIDPVKRKNYDIDKLRNAVQLGKKNIDELNFMEQKHKTLENIKILLNESEEILNILDMD